MSSGVERISSTSTEIAQPARGAKFSLFEGGIRLPAMVSWPGVLPANVVSDQLVHACDLLPTLADLAGIEPPEVHLDGRSLATVLKDPTTGDPHARRPLHWQVGRGEGAEWAVRDGDWKLLANVRDTGGSDKRIPLFLANLKNDPAETTNLAERHPEIVARLRKLHDRHLD